MLRMSVLLLGIYILKKHRFKRGAKFGAKMSGLQNSKNLRERRRPCHYWRERVRIELTMDGTTAQRLVLKTRSTTRHHPLPQQILLYRVIQSESSLHDFVLE